MSDRRAELIEKIVALVDRDYAGGYFSAFNWYDRDHDGGLNKQELNELLKDAEVGTRLTRWVWVDGILNELDQDRDGRITFQEFESAIHKG